MEDRDLLMDIVKDTKHQNKFMRRAIILLTITVIGLIASFVAVVLHSQNVIKEMALEHERKMIELLTETEMSTEYVIETDNQSLNNGYINVNK